MSERVKTVMVTRSFHICRFSYLDPQLFKLDTLACVKT